jgi:hypothetical protein
VAIAAGDAVGVPVGVGVGRGICAETFDERNTAETSEITNNVRYGSDLIRLVIAEILPKMRL